MFTLFHISTPARTVAILRDGFVDERGKDTTEREMRGVFLTNRPLDDESEETGGIVLAVIFNLPVSELADFELIEEDTPYREWCVPADFIKRQKSNWRTAYRARFVLAAVRGATA